MDLTFTSQVTQKPLAQRHHFILRPTRSLDVPHTLTSVSVGSLRLFNLTAQLDQHQTEYLTLRRSTSWLGANVHQDCERPRPLPLA
jgi:hypothetical protein